MKRPEIKPFCAKLLPNWFQRFFSLSLSFSSHLLNYIWVIFVHSSVEITWTMATVLLELKSIRQTTKVCKLLKLNDFFLPCNCFCFLTILFILNCVCSNWLKMYASVEFCEYQPNLECIAHPFHKKEVLNWHEVNVRNVFRKS